MHLFFSHNSSIEFPFFVVATALVPDPSEARKQLEDLRQSLLTNRFRMQVASVRHLTNRSFDYDSDHPSVRDDVMAVIGRMAVRSAAWFSGKNGASDQQMSDLESRALSAVIAATMRNGHRGDVHLYTTDNAEVELEEHVAFARSRDDKSGYRRTTRVGAAVRVHRTHDHDPCVVLPNYISGIVNAAIGATSVERDAARRNYLKIAHRIGAVVDADRGISYFGDSFISQLQQKESV